MFVLRHHSRPLDRRDAIGGVTDTGTGGPVVPWRELRAVLTSVGARNLGKSRFHRACGARLNEIGRARRRQTNVDLTWGVARPCPRHVHTARNRSQPTKCARTAPGRAWTMVPPSAPFCVKNPNLRKTQKYQNYGRRGRLSTIPGVFHTSGARCGTQ